MWVLKGRPLGKPFFQQKFTVLYNKNKDSLYIQLSQQTVMILVRSIPTAAAHLLGHEPSCYMISTLTDNFVLTAPFHPTP